MRSLANNLVFLITAAFLALFAADIVLWPSHPFAAIAGGAAASMLNPMLLIPMLLCGFAAGARWQIALIGIAWAAGLELWVSNSLSREFIGEDRFLVWSWINRTVGAYVSISLAAGLRMLLLRTRRDGAAAASPDEAA